MDGTSGRTTRNVAGVAGARVAGMVLQIKYKAPPAFTGKKDEDAADWLERYEAVGTYIQWGDAEMHGNFGMYLEGTACLWFRCLTVPGDWADQPAQAQGSHPIPGLRTIFLREFLPDGYTRHQEAKLIVQSR